ncbi:MAG: hypothetical protein OEV66_12505 [Spirochaetia bacterium]|nr:hypothetical protein [Spirochaetia bacterium]
MTNQIKVLFSDIDGTMTDGQLYYGEHGEALKVFNVKDGAGIKRWISAGNEFGVISARSSQIIITRMNELGVKHVITGAADKNLAMNLWLSENQYSWENLAYIGDDMNDLMVISKAAVSAAPSDAAALIISSVQYHCMNSGGRGALREFIDFLLDSSPPS